MSYFTQNWKVCRSLQTGSDHSCKLGLFLVPNGGSTQTLDCCIECGDPLAFKTSATAALVLAAATENTPPPNHHNHQRTWSLDRKTRRTSSSFRWKTGGHESLISKAFLYKVIYRWCVIEASFSY